MAKKKEKHRNGPDIMGTAMLDYVKGRSWENIRTWTSVGGMDELPLPYLFRSYEQMPALEREALDLSRGKVLDIGCGAGSHALWLQEKGLEVKAIDVSAGAVETCRARGLASAEVLDIWELKEERYDTLLLLMNGMGICSKLGKLTRLLKHLRQLLKPGGQILADSSDIIYMYESADFEEDDEDELPSLPADHYYGEVTFQTFYKELRGEPFPWLYVDFYNLQLHASAAGLRCELVLQGEHYDYLARLTPSDSMPTE